jgi:hypothetical protein
MAAHFHIEGFYLIPVANETLSHIVSVYEPGAVKNAGENLTWSNR